MLVTALSIRETTCRSMPPAGENRAVTRSTADCTVTLSDFAGLSVCVEDDGESSRVGDGVGTVAGGGITICVCFKKGRRVILAPVLPSTERKSSVLLPDFQAPSIHRSIESRLRSLNQSRRSSSFSLRL